MTWPGGYFGTVVSQLVSWGRERNLKLKEEGLGNKET